MNCSKTKAVLFRSKGTMCHLYERLALNNHEIEILPTAKTLGVYFHEHMQWDSHSDSVKAKLSRVVSALRRCQTLLPTKQKITLSTMLSLPPIWFTVTWYGVKVPKRPCRAWKRTKNRLYEKLETKETLLNCSKI